MSKSWLPMYQEEEDDEGSTAESLMDMSDRPDANSTSNGTPDTKSMTDKEHEKALAEAETRTIHRLKLIMMFVLIGVAIGIGAYAYTYARDVQHEEFESAFQSHGQKLVNGFYQDSFQKLQSMESLSSSVTYLFRNETWPFVTIPDSPNFFKPFLTMSGAASIKFLPIVGVRQRLQWEQHVSEQQNWVHEAIELHNEPSSEVHQSSPSGAPTDAPSSLPSTMATSSISMNETSSSSPTIRPTEIPSTRRRRTQYFEIDETLRVSPYIKSHVGVDTSPGVWAPVWQYYPVVPNNNYYINFNQLVDHHFQEDFPILTQKKNAVIARTESYVEGLDFQSTRDLEFTQEMLRISGYGTYEPGEPIGLLHYPVFQSSSSRDKVVAILTASVYWKSYFQNILPETARGIICVVENEEQQFTYRIDGSDATFLGHSDLHDPKYDDMEVYGEYKAFDNAGFSDQQITFNQIYTGVPVDESRLSYRIRIYPSQEMADEFVTNEPGYYAAVVSGVMLIAVLVFAVYDWYVERRQKKVSNIAIQSNAIVSSLFPQGIKEKLYQTTPPASTRDVFRRSAGKPNSSRSPNSPRPTALSPSDNGGEAAAPIADFFPSATVLFMDIAGFTAWSSSREPSQVFILLETLFKNFDKMALRRRVFKVETIGDCYLAVCGLPEPCERHAHQMASFARDCLEKTAILAHELIPTLGPETARMESTGKKGRIQCSKECAEQLRKWGKESWLRKREDKVLAKGKGEMETYWILPKRAGTARSGAMSMSSGDSADFDESENNDAVEYMTNQFDLSARGESTTPVTPQIDLIADFNYDILLKSLKAIVSKRNITPKKPVSRRLGRSLSNLWNSDREILPNSCLDEVAEVIELPDDGDQPIDEWENAVVEIPQKVKDQLREYCRKIASMYQSSNPFHNFEHASHVTQSSSKLLSRIVSIRNSDTFGIAADPLTHFAVIFSSMIHDVDHRGVPNFILAKEEPEMAKMYQNQAIAEQNSIDLAWELLMETRFSGLRHTIYSDSTEQQRFRNLVVNCLLATDIFDKDLKSMREKRWEKAFHSTSMQEDARVQSNRKATIVIEHIIQASDVSHTMQHWHVYQKWNQRLFEEMHKAFVDGRAENDPTAGWYKGELWFFDNYVIPLAKKLEECQVFGVSSDEYLLYAQANRDEWENKGEKIVQEYAARLKEGDERRNNEEY